MMTETAVMLVIQS